MPIKNELNIPELEEQFGSDLATKIKMHVSVCQEKNQNYSIEITDQTDRFTTFIFATFGYAYVYMVSNNRKTISDESFIGYCECKKALEMMKNFQA